MSTAKYPEYLYRYTSVDYMFDTVRNNKLYLTNPEKWRDQNDAKQLEAYRERLKAPAVWVLCLSETRDSLFHWNAIDTEPEKRCFVQFYVPELFASLVQYDDVQFKKVRYQKIVDAQRAVKSKPPDIKKLPFLKRHPYRIEKEWRILWLGASQNNLKELAIGKRAISGVTISQDMEDGAFDTWKTKLTEHGLKSTQTHHSTLNQNNRFLNCFGIDA